MCETTLSWGTHVTLLELNTQGWLGGPLCTNELQQTSIKFFLYTVIKTKESESGNMYCCIIMIVTVPGCMLTRVSSPSIIGF